MQGVQFFILHTFIKRKQSDLSEEWCKAADGRLVIVQVDFTENYAAKSS